LEKKRAIGKREKMHQCPAATMGMKKESVVFNDLHPRDKRLWEAAHLHIWDGNPIGVDPLSLG